MGAMEATVHLKGNSRQKGDNGSVDVVIVAKDINEASVLQMGPDGW
jgi:hypothetical protein